MFKNVCADSMYKIKKYLFNTFGQIMIEHKSKGRTIIPSLYEKITY